MSEANKAIVQSYADAFNRGDLEAVCSLFAEDALVWGVLGWGNLDKARPIWRALMDCYGICLTIEEMAAEGDTVAVRYTERGRSLKPFLGGPDPTGKTYEMTAMEFFHIQNGRIQRRWGARDSATQLRQMGLPLS